MIGQGRRLIGQRCRGNRYCARNAGVFRRNITDVCAALQVNSDLAYAMSYELSDVVGIRQEPLMKQKWRAIPGLIHAHDIHSEF